MPDNIILIDFLNTINPFNQEVAKNFYNIKYPAYNLKYCLTRDTLHSFDGNKCFNCCGFQEPSIGISSIDFRDFRKHFGEAYPLKLIEIIDDWPKKNNFPFIHNDIINSLPEYQKLNELHNMWMRLTKEQKLNEIFDISSIQKQYYSKLTEVSNIKNKLI